MFSIALHIPSEVHPRRQKSNLWDESEEFEALVLLGCNLVAETGCHFWVGGFGQDEWPVSLPYDLAVVLEQLPELLLNIRKRKETELDFYSQGLQRVLDFSPSDEGWKIRCRSGTNWVPDPEIETITSSHLESSLVKLAEDFVSILRQLAPRIAEAPPFSAWARGVI
ncbi:hypothetical protein [Streptosporangium sp. H16]|uniref:hypothetical protein n=1 Tax=Streptosporangium sp. H16 TaxID=3444184 RepID=UPI003F79FFEF